MKIHHAHIQCWVNAVLGSYAMSCHQLHDFIWLKTCIGHPIENLVYSVEWSWDHIIGSRFSGVWTTCEESESWCSFTICQANCTGEVDAS